MRRWRRVACFSSVVSAFRSLIARFCFQSLESGSRFAVQSLGFTDVTELFCFEFQGPGVITLGLIGNWLSAQAMLVTTGL